MWTFSCPFIAYGDNALEYIAQIQGKKAFIVTDKNIVKLGLTKLVTDQLDAVKIKWQIFDEVEPEPSLNTVKKGGVAVGKYQPAWAIVRTDTNENRKLGLGTTECMPDVAILDPVMVAGMPPKITADTGMDVITHAIEGYVSTWGTSITEGPGLIATRKTLEYLPKAYKNGDDLEARKEMQNAATLGGMSFGNSMAGLGHSTADGP